MTTKLKQVKQENIFMTEQKTCTRGLSWF